MENLEKRITKIKRVYKTLACKTDLFMALSPRVGRTPKTLEKHWFSNSRMSSDIPRDPEVLTIIEDEMRKAPKKKRTLRKKIS